MPNLDNLVEIADRVGRRLIESRKQLEEGIIQEVTVLYADIAGFTSLTEKLDNPDRLAKHINVYANPIADHVKALDAHLESWAGDAGIIVTKPFEAVILAHMIEELVQKHSLINIEKKRIKMGMHSGIGTGKVFEAVIGNKRRKYIIVGDAIDAQGSWV